MGEEVGVIAELSRVDRRWRWSGRANTDCGSEMASANRKAQTATSARLLLMSQPRPPEFDSYGRKSMISLT